MSGAEVPVVTCPELGQLEKLELGTRPRRAPEADHVSVDVKACGVNFVDALMAQGRYQIRPTPPYVPGGEVAGVIDELGPGVEGLAVGDRVIAMTGMGGFAGQVVAHASRVLPLPEGLDFARGAALLQSYCTALFALTRRSRVEAGETVLVLGAAGGVGMAAIDVARSLGARVIAGASTAAKLEACRAAGADLGLNYAEEDLKSRAKELSGGGVDVVVDPVGDALAEPALRTLRPGGRYLVIGFAGGEIPRVPWNLILLKSCQVIGVDWGGFGARDPAANQALIEDLAGRVARGELSPAPPAERPLAEAGRVLQELIDRRIAGKVVLVP